MWSSKLCFTWYRLKPRCLSNRSNNLLWGLSTVFPGYITFTQIIPSVPRPHSQQSHSHYIGDTPYSYPWFTLALCFKRETAVLKSIPSVALGRLLFISSHVVGSFSIFRSTQLITLESVFTINPQILCNFRWWLTGASLAIPVPGI